MRQSHWMWNSWTRSVCCIQTVFACSPVNVIQQNVNPSVLPKLQRTCWFEVYKWKPVVHLSKLLFLLTSFIFQNPSSIFLQTATSSIPFYFWPQISSALWTEGKPALHSVEIHRTKFESEGESPTSLISQNVSAEPKIHYGLGIWIRFQALC